MLLNFSTLFSICAALVMAGSVAFGQCTKIEPFEKIKVRGVVAISYYVSKESAIQIVHPENESLIKYKVSKGKLTIKHLKIKPNQNKQVEINLWGMPVKEISASQIAVVKSDSVILTDTANVCLSSGSELHTKVKSALLKMRLVSGSFGYLEGEVGTLELNTKTGAKFRAHKANISKAIVKITTGGFAALKGETEVEGKVVTGGELKFYGKSNDSKIKRHTHGIIRQSEVDDL